jgi:hypothetical protein
VLLFSELVSPAGGIAIWDGRSVVDLQLPWVRPEDINDLGQVVGCRGAGNEGVVWDGGTVVSLGPGTCAWGLNNVGMAVGGWQAPSGSWQPALWQARRLATPDEETALLSATIEQLANVGTLDRGRARSLTALVEAAASALDRGNPTAAANLLTALVNQVEALVRTGQLTATDAAGLLDAANNAIRQLQG